QDPMVGLRVGGALGAHQQDAGPCPEAEGISQPAGRPAPPPPAAGGPGGAPAPVSPATMPAAARSRMAWRARSSATATTASRPDRSNGQATSDGVPQLSPAMMESWGPGAGGVPPRPPAAPPARRAAGGAPPPGGGGAPGPPRRCQCRTAAAASPP